MNPKLLAASVFGGWATIATPAIAQCVPEWLPGASGVFPSYGPNSYPTRFFSWYPPGSSSPLLMMTGLFTTVANGSPPFNYIASWDGTAWGRLTGSLGTGLDGPAYDMVDFNGQLVVGGRFTTAGGTPAMYVARWTGSQWIGMGVLGFVSTGAVSCLKVYNGQLYAGGDFLVGGAEVSAARWDGTSWQAVPGIGTGAVASMEVYGTDLIIGGLYSANGSSQGVMKWNGSTLSPMGSGIFGYVRALRYRPADNSLYVGGTFSSAGGVPTGNLARWDGAWHDLGGSFPNQVNALELYGTDVIIGGWTPGPPGYIGRYDGVSISPLGAGVGQSSVIAMGVYKDSLYVGGTLDSAGGIPVQDLAEWSGNPSGGWSAVKPGPNAAVRALLPSGTGFYAAGDFDFFTDSTNGTAHRIVFSDGATASTVTNLAGGGGPPNGTNGSIHALANWAAGSIILPHSYLIVGGSFTAAGGLAASNVAQFDINGWAQMGTGTDGPVNAVQAYRVSSSNNHVVVAGSFSIAGGAACSNIAQWNAGWTAMGSGLNGAGNALTLFNGELYVGGNFSSAGGIPASDIARWNGSAWNALSGTQFTGGIYALTVYNSAAVIAAGDFQSTNSPTPIRFAAAWTGSAWLPMDAGLPPAGSGFFPQALAVHEGNLFLGGQYSITDGPGDGLFNSTVFRWTGAAWVPVSAGDLSGGVYALTSAAGSLWAGGSFTVASGHATPYLAKLSCACYANCDFSYVPPSLNVNDFACFLNRFAAGDPYANCDGSATPPVVNVLDFACFLNKFAAGCP